MTHALFGWRENVPSLDRLRLARRIKGGGNISRFAFLQAAIKGPLGRVGVRRRL